MNNNKAFKAAVELNQKYNINSTGKIAINKNTINVGVKLNAHEIEFLNAHDEIREEYAKAGVQLLGPNDELSN